MPRELEYQIRAFIAAVLVWTGMAAYERQYHEEFWGEFPAAVLCFHIAALALLWWRGPQADIHPLIHAIRDLSKCISDAAKGREREVKEEAAAEREKGDDPPG